MAAATRIAAAILAFAFHACALAQSALGIPAAAEVQSLAPQLVIFAGSDANFRNLVNGLSQGIPVTLVTTGADGSTQTVTFTPASTMTAAEIARTLETARQLLIARGIANPTAEQIGITLVGGTLPTPSGNVTVASLVTAATPGALRSAASAGGSIARFAPANPASPLSVEVRPATPVTPTNTSDTARFTNTSDNTRLGHTSDSPVSTSGGTTSSGSTSATPSGATSPGLRLPSRR